MSRASELHDILVSPPNSLPIAGLSVGADPGPTTATSLDGQVVKPEWATPPTAQQQALFASVVGGFDLRPQRPRTIFAIRADINALSAAQKTAIWTNLSAGTPPLWALDAGRNAAAIAAIEWAATVPAGISTAERTEARLRLAAMYVQDNPRYLVNPSFDATISIKGDEVDPSPEG